MIKMVVLLFFNLQAQNRISVLVDDLKGTHLIWYNDDITTAIYAFWSDIYTYDGSIIKSYDLTENELIYDLAFSDNNTKLIVTITRDDGTERTEIIDL